MNARKITKISVWIFVSMLISYPNLAQQPTIYQAPDILPPSPTAAELDKYGLVPVNLSTGTPQVDIPLYEFKTRNLSLPISLSYYSNGVKVDEIASWVGMGWSLNCGGVISRIVRDDPDESGYGVNQPPFPSEFNTSDPKTINLINFAAQNYDADFEPDLFTYNFQGYTGKFVFDRSGVLVMIPYNNLKIERIAQQAGTGYFIITTPDGVKYTFGAVETSKTSPMSEAKSYLDPIETSWYLTKIEHPLGDIITLAYDTVSYSYVTGVTQTYTGVLERGEECGPSACPTTVPSSTERNSIFVYALHLSQISATNYGSIQFYASQDRSDLSDYKLNEILVRDKYNAPFKHFNFTYEFSDNSNVTYINTYNNYNDLKHRMFLTQLEEKDAQNVSQKKHRFFYNDMDGLPARLAFAQDHWGYFNGADNDDFVPPNNTTTDYTGGYAFPNIGGDREPDFNYAQKGILTKIIYPTGGSSNFEYEPNDYYGEVTNYPNPTHYQLSCNADPGTPPMSSIDTIYSPTNQTIEYTFSVSLISGYSDPGVGGQLNITDITAGGPPLLSLPLDYGNNTTDYLALTAGHSYKFELEAKGTGIGTFIYFDYYATAPQTVQQNITIGGLRISEVINHDPTSGEDEVTNYYYAQHDQLTHSSGRGTGIPVYYREYTTKSPCGVDCSMYHCKYGALYSNNNNNLFQPNGSNIFYQYVIVSHGAGFENGFEEHEFTIHLDDQATQVWGNALVNDIPLTNSGWDNGKEKSVKYYKTDGSDFVLIRDIENHYEPDPRGYHEVPSLVVRKKYDPQCPEQVVINCDASNINLTQSIYTCLTNHEHKWIITTFGIWCTAPGHNMGNLTIYQSPCYGKNIGDTAIVYRALDNLDAFEYKNESFWSYLDNTTETDYDINGNNPVVKETNYYYDNPVNALLTRTQSTMSNGKSINTIMKYPDDYDPGSNVVIDSLLSKNIINVPVKQETTLDGNQISGTVVSYNDLGQPVNVYNYESPDLKSPVTHDSTLIVPSADYKLKTILNYYSSDNNLRDLQQKDNLTTTYLWAYDNSLPVAKIENATYQDILSVVNQSGIDSLGLSSNEIFIKNKLAALRNGLTEAFVTGFIWKPLYGVTKEIDPNGIEKRYLYDDFARPIIIRDNQDNIVNQFDYHYFGQ